MDRTFGKYRIAFLPGEADRVDTNIELDNVWLSTVNNLEDFERIHGNNGATPRIVFEIGEVVCEEDEVCEYIDAWRFDDNTNPTKVVCDVDAVKEVIMKRIRLARNQVLASWDPEHKIAEWQNKEEYLNDILAKKQRLRDIPQDIEDQVNAATTMAELKPLRFPAGLLTDAIPEQVAASGGKFKLM